MLEECYLHHKVHSYIVIIFMGFILQKTKAYEDLSFWYKICNSCNKDTHVNKNNKLNLNKITTVTTLLIQSYSSSS